MQEVRYNGSEKLTEDASRKQLDEALADERNATVAIHKPGAVFKSRGKTYQVTDEGKLKRQQFLKNKSVRKAQKAARRRNR